MVLVLDGHRPLNMCVKDMWVIIGLPNPPNECQTWGQFLESNANSNYGSRDYFNLDETKSLYPLTLNNPTVTGITTQACIYKSEPAVCLPNASLVTE